MLKNTSNTLLWNSFVKKRLLTPNKLTKSSPSMFTDSKAIDYLREAELGNNPENKLIPLSEKGSEGSDLYKVNLYNKFQMLHAGKYIYPDSIRVSLKKNFVSGKYSQGRGELEINHLDSVWMNEKKQNY